VRTRTGYDAFVPNALPPAISWSDGVVAAVERTSLVLGRLAGSLEGESRIHVLLLLVRDAVGAVRSEGRTISTTAFFEALATGATDSATMELVRNYVATFEYARRRIDELPLSLRLLRELHFALLEGVADPRSTPGEFRRTQNWLGQPGCTPATATFVPPPAAEMRELLHNWECFLHESGGLPALVRLALAHCQYLILHPFLDMNVLTGAVLAPLVLQHMGVMDRPLPVFGRWLERHAGSLLSRMLDVCAHGTWEEWLTWYLHGVADVAGETLDCIVRLRTLRAEQAARVEMLQGRDSARRVLDLLHGQPSVTPEWVSEHGNLTPAESIEALNQFESAGIVAHSVSARGDIYIATDIIAALETPFRGGSDYALPF
jgi:Fic family protein